MRLHLSRAVRMCFDPQAIAPFLIASVSLSVVANGFYEFLRDRFQAGGWATPLVIAGGAGLVLLGAVAWLAFLLSRQTGELEGITEETPERRRGLILLVSQSELCKAAITFHQPTLKRVWLICSKTSLSVAQEIQRQFPNIDFTISDPPLHDVEHPQSCFRAVRQIYRERLSPGWSPNDVISDCTGMTKTATIGLVMACIGRDRPVQYTPGRYEHGKLVGALAPIELCFDWTGISRTPPADQSPDREGAPASAADATT